MRSQPSNPPTFQPSNLPTSTFGLEITLEHPAAQLRQEITQLRQAVSQISPPSQKEGDKTLPPATCNPATCNPATLLLAQDPLFLDIETTALYKKDDPRPVEIAVINSQGQVLLSTLINPGCPIPPAATAHNGITNADVADAPTWRQIEPLLKHILTAPPLGGTEGRRTIVAFNAKFDSQFIPPAWPLEWACAKDLANQILGKANWWDIKQNPLLGGSLPARLHQLGLPPGPAHTAAGDCLSTLRLVRRLAGETQPVELAYPWERAERSANRKS
ncbi:MAG: 3'-5' exonuclease [Anaerolineae bacterium]|nr:3'-5' exonuclease [Anaerolineae bacterium]